MVLAAIWEFLKKIPGWAWLVLAGALVGFTYVQSEKARVRRETNEKNERESLKEQARVSETRREITQENQDAVVRADEAVADLPRYRHTDELRNTDEALAAIVLGNRSGRGERTEGN